MACSPVLSNYLITKFLQVLTDQGTYTSPTTVYLALYTSNPMPANSGTEVSGGSYARQAISWATVSGETTSNNANITFPTATGNWGAITYWALFDASTSGNLLMFAPVSVTVTVNSGQSYPVITAGELVMSLQ